MPLFFCRIGCVHIVENHIRVSVNDETPDFTLVAVACGSKELVAILLSGYEEV